MGGDIEERRQFYLAKIKEAEEFAAKSSDPTIHKDMQLVIEGYRKLLTRLSLEQSKE